MTETEGEREKGLREQDGKQKAEWEGLWREEVEEVKREGRHM